MTGGKGQGRVARLLGVATTALLLLLWTSTSPTLSAWTSGVVANPANTTSSASVAFSHTPGGCSLGPKVAGASTVCSGSPVGTDAITNNGTAVPSTLAQTVGAASCLPAQLTNAKAATDVMLPRYATGFRAVDPWGGTNAITLDGTAYAAAVTRDQAASSSTYGMGIWFKASAGQGGPLFSLDSSPVNAATANGDDRTLYLDGNGKLNFVFMTSGQKLTSTNTVSYADGAWHFAYVTLTQNFLAISTSLYVDTAPVLTVGGGLLSAYSTVNGYWHAGWGSTALMGAGTQAYFTGALSNFVVFNNGGAPARPTAAQLGSQSAFSGWATVAALSDHWLLGDTGLTTYSGTHPTLGAGVSPCASLKIDWTFTNPAASAASGAVLSAWANGTDYAVTAPAPGTTQTSTLAITRRTAPDYNAYVAGLRLLIPFTHKVSTLPGNKWSLTFTWDPAASVVIAP